MRATIDTALQRIKPEYRPTVKQLAWNFISEEITPSTISIPIDTVLVWAIEHAIDMLGMEEVKGIGVADLWSFMYHYLELNIGSTEKGSRYYVPVKLSRYRQKRTHIKGHNNNLFDVERALGLRPPKVSVLVKYSVKEHGPKDTLN